MSYKISYADDPDAPLKVIQPPEVCKQLAEDLAEAKRIASSTLAKMYPGIVVRHWWHAIPDDKKCRVCLRRDPMRKKRHFTVLTRNGCGLAACYWCVNDFEQFMLVPNVEGWCEDHKPDLTIRGARRERAQVQVKVISLPHHAPAKKLANLIMGAKRAGRVKNIYATFPHDMCCPLCGHRTRKKAGWLLLTLCGPGLSCCPSCAKAADLLKVLGDYLCQL